MMARTLANVRKDIIRSMKLVSPRILMRFSLFHISAPIIAGVLGFLIRSVARRGFFCSFLLCLLPYFRYLSDFVDIVCGLCCRQVHNDNTTEVPSASNCELDFSLPKRYLMDLLLCILMDEVLGGSA